MTINEIKDLLDAEIICGEDSDEDVLSACGSDMMSDVLAYVKDQAILLTGLVNAQVIRTAEMMDMRGIVFVRNKKPTKEMVELAESHDVVLMSTPRRMFEACGILYSKGLQGEGALNV